MTFLFINGRCFVCKNNDLVSFLGEKTCDIFYMESEFLFVNINFVVRVCLLGEENCDIF